ncbi:MAG: hypothetical protein M1379_16755 [Firmicutes bacterium]|nr:hypothetical protein [Bacillota bacterium]
MEQKKSGVTMIFGLLLAVTLGGILFHLLTGYDYPSAPATDFELNTLGDLYEAFFLIPAGLIGLWVLRKGSAWGPLLIVGVAANLAYNYAMLAAGRQNPWIFLWIAKLALAGTTVCLVWRLLPPGLGRRSGRRWGAAIYLVVAGLALSGMMWQRLLASAAGRTVEMTMQASGTVDWGEPVLRDAVVFFSLAFPVLITAVLGLVRGTDWGGRAAAAMNAFIVSIISIVLFTGPLKEALLSGSVSAPMWRLSVMMILAAAPAVYFLIRPVKDETRPI